MPNQNKIIERIACLLTGVILDKKHAELLYSIVMPLIIAAGVKNA